MGRRVLFNLKSEEQISRVNYFTYAPNKEIWFSAGFQEKVNIMSKPKIAHPMEKAYLFAMQDESSSKHKTTL